MKKKSFSLHTIRTVKILATVAFLAVACLLLVSCQTAQDVHVHTVIVDDAVPATCVTSGLTAGAHCADCGDVIAAQQVIEATGHVVVSSPAVEPTCTTQGLTGGAHCTVCGEVFKEQTLIQPLGHEPVVDAAVAPTCLATGLTQGSHCADCGAVIKKQDIISTKAHTSVVDAAVAPTCQATGLTQGAHCYVCNVILKEQTVIDSQGHTSTMDAALEPTCTKSGLTAGSHCSVCGVVLQKQEILPATGHSIVTQEAVAPTVLLPGYTMGVACEVCGEVLVEQEKIPVLTPSDDPTAEQQETMTPQEKAVLKLAAYQYVMRREYTDAEIAAMQSLDIAEVRQKINTLGDAIQYVDMFTNVFYTGGYKGYDLQWMLRSLQDGYSYPQIYTLLSGYLLSDNMPELVAMIAAGSRSNYDVYTGLLMPYQSSWLVISPAYYSAKVMSLDYGANGFSVQIIPTLASSDDLVDALHTTGDCTDETLCVLYVFKPEEETYTMNYNNRNLTCDRLDSLLPEREKGYDTIVSRLLLLDTALGVLAEEEASAELLQKLIALCDADLETAAVSIHTVHEALAFLIVREYDWFGNTIGYGTKDGTWTFIYGVDTIYEVNGGEYSSTASLIGYLLQGDYEESGYIFSAYPRDEGTGHVINYVKANGIYYVFDLGRYVCSNYSNRNIYLGCGETLADAYVAFCDKTYENEILAVYWTDDSVSIPVYYGYYNTQNTVTLIEQYKDQFQILYQDENATVEYKEIPVWMLEDVERQRNK